MSANTTALVLGGTGMLAELVVRLSNQYEAVGVVGRSKNKLEQLSSRSGKIVPIQADYTDKSSFDEILKDFTKHYGKPSLIVSWVHSSSPNIPVLVADYCKGDFYDITGSSGREQSHISHINQPKITVKGVKYHRIILGQIHNRWLTNQEISDGVYQAIQKALDEYIVGE